MFQLSGEQSWISYTAHYIQAGPQYPGYYRNLDSKSASVMLRPLGWLRLEGSLQKQQQGFVADQQRTYDTYRLGTGLQGHPWGQPAYFYVYYRNKQWAYSQTDFVLERREEAVEMRAGYNVGRAGIIGSFGLGRTQTPSLDYTGSFREYQIEIRFASRSGQAFTASIEYLSGTLPFRPEPQRRWLGRVSAALQLSSRTRFLLNLHGSIERRHTSDRSYRAIQALFEHRFPWEHRLQVKGLYRSFDAFLDQGVADYTLAYTIPFNVPVPQQKQEKRMTGRVYDAETGEGLKRVVLYMGDRTAMTGSDGTFSFPMPAPGTYYLYFDRLSVGLDRVPRSAMPMEIQVGTEPMPEIDIALVRSARVSGRIEIQENPDSLGVLLDGPPQVVLELTDAVGRHRCLSDRNGHFSFKEVYPGPLTVRVVHAKLPAYYYLEQDIYTFDVTPGGQQHVQIRVLPERRQIRMIDGAPRRRQNPPLHRQRLRRNDRD